MNVLIFSKCLLTSFSFEMIFNDLYTQPLTSNRVIVNSCSTIESIAHEEIKEMDFILLDMTGVNYTDFYTLLVKIKALGTAKIIILCNEYADLCILPIIYNAVLYKSSSILQILTTIRRVYDRFYDGRIINFGRDITLTNTLSRRESETLRYILYGLSNVEIAEVLSLSHKTVSAYRRSICRKYGIKSLNFYYYKSRL